MQAVSPATSAPKNKAHKAAPLQAEVSFIARCHLQPSTQSGRNLSSVRPNASPGPGAKTENTQIVLSPVPSEQGDEGEGEVVRRGHQ